MTRRELALQLVRASCNCDLSSSLFRPLRATALSLVIPSRDHKFYRLGNNSDFIIRLNPSLQQLFTLFSAYAKQSRNVLKNIFRNIKMFLRKRSIIKGSYEPTREYVTV